VKPGAREGELRIKVLGLRARFVLSMSLALAAVLAVTGVLLYMTTARLLDTARDDSLGRAARFTHEPAAPQVDTQGRSGPHGVQIFPYHSSQGSGRVFRHETGGQAGEKLERFDLYVPDSPRGSGDLLRIIAVICVVVLVVAAGVSVWVASTVSRPVVKLIDDVRQLAKGDLTHRVKTDGPGEIRLLARALDRMASDLSEGQESKLELSVREREVELATGVRDALLPAGTPLIEGYDLGAAFLASPRFGGDFHDFVQRADGKWGVLVCDVSGRGIPAALVGSIARAYLRAELVRSGEVAEAFQRANRWLSGDVRRGMFVTALYAMLEPSEGRVTVACAGHKIPLLRVCAADGQLRVVQPEGIALGLDKGSVFERRLQVVEVPLEPGDRLVLTNSAPVRIANASGEELGEKAFYARVKKHATADTTQFLRALRRDLEQYAGDPGFQEDLSIVTVARNRT